MPIAFAKVDVHVDVVGLIVIIIRITTLACIKATESRTTTQKEQRKSKIR